MSVYIGAVTFDDSLRWLRFPPKSVGADVDASEGSIVSITVVSPSQTENRAQLQTDWIPWSTIEALQIMAAARTTFTMQPEDDVATTYTIRFAADNAVADFEHVAFGKIHPSAVESYVTDLWKVTLNVIVISS